MVLPALSFLPPPHGYMCSRQWAEGPKYFIAEETKGNMLTSEEEICLRLWERKRSSYLSCVDESGDTCSRGNILETESLELRRIF